MAVTMMNAIFWDVTPCGSCRKRRFGGTYRLHHLGDKNRLARNNISSKLRDTIYLQRASVGSYQVPSSLILVT
jgi:hypothetical protein